jgi:hypothetical protein
MRRGRLWLGAMLLALPALAGCQGALAGDWRLVQASPSRAVMALDDVHFARDGRFAATTTLDGRTRREVGTFAFHGVELTLRPEAGGQRKYSAQLTMNRLELSDGTHHVVLERKR